MAAEEPYGPGIGATVSAALVTGGAKRIGRAIALTLARNGWKVAIHFHGSAAAAEEVVAEITKAGGTAVALQADLSREAELTALLPAAEAALGPVTLLVNNASVFDMDTINTVTRESWDRHLEVG